MEIEKQITLDLLDQQAPALSSISDMPKIETKPDAVQEVKPETTPETPPEAKEPEAEKAEESAPPEQPEDSSATTEEPKKSKGVQKRIDELVRLREDEKRRAEAAEARLDRALAALEKGTVSIPKPPEVSESEPVRPQRDPNDPEGSDAAMEKYIVERASWIAKQEVQRTLTEQAQKDKQARFSTELETVQKNYADRAAKAKEKYPDYSQVAESKDVEISQPMAFAIAQSEHGPDIAYYLGDDARKGGNEAKRISSMTIRDPEGNLVPNVARQLLELGKIEAKLTITPAPQPKPISAAPAPGKPIKATSEVTVPDEELSMDEYATKWKAREALKNRPGVRH